MIINVYIFIIIDPISYNYQIIYIPNFLLLNSKYGIQPLKQYHITNSKFHPSDYIFIFYIFNYQQIPHFLTRRSITFPSGTIVHYQALKFRQFSKYKHHLSLREKFEPVMIDTQVDMWSCSPYPKLTLPIETNFGKKLRHWLQVHNRDSFELSIFFPDLINHW